MKNPLRASSRKRKAVDPGDFELDLSATFKPRKKYVKVKQSPPDSPHKDSDHSGQTQDSSATVQRMPPCKPGRQSQSVSAEHSTKPPLSDLKEASLQSWTASHSYDSVALDSHAVALLVGQPNNLSVLVAKKLSGSDIEKRRIILPIRAVEANMPFLRRHRQYQLLCLDCERQDWRFRVCAWMRGSTPGRVVYVLDHVGPYMDKFGLRVGDTVAICANSDGRLVFECDTERHRCPDISAATDFTTLTVVAGDVPLEPIQPPPAAAENSGGAAGAGAAKGSMKSADIPPGGGRWGGMASETGPRQGGGGLGEAVRRSKRSSRGRTAEDADVPSASVQTEGPPSRHTNQGVTEAEPARAPARGRRIAHLDEEKPAAAAKVAAEADSWELPLSWKAAKHEGRPWAPQSQPQTKDQKSFPLEGFSRLAVKQEGRPPPKSQPRNKDQKSRFLEGLSSEGCFRPPSARLAARGDRSTTSLAEVVGDHERQRIPGERAVGLRSPRKKEDMSEFADILIQMSLTAEQQLQAAGLKDCCE